MEQSANLNPEETTVNNAAKTVLSNDAQQPPETSKATIEDKTTQQPEGDYKEHEVAQPEWLANELEHLNKLKSKFTQKYKNTFQKAEACNNEEECFSLTNELYLQLMQRVLKTVGVDRGAVLLEKLQEKRGEIESSVSGSGEAKEGDNKP